MLEKLFVKKIFSISFKNPVSVKRNVDNSVKFQLLLDIHKLSQTDRSNGMLTFSCFPHPEKKVFSYNEADWMTYQEASGQWVLLVIVKNIFVLQLLWKQSETKWLQLKSSVRSAVAGQDVEEVVHLILIEHGHLCGALRALHRVVNLICIHSRWLRVSCLIHSHFWFLSLPPLPVPLFPLRLGFVT